MTAHLTVADITHRYGELDVIAGVGFDVAPGTCTALIGPTGCGKSTLLRILAGLIRPTAGAIRIDGVDAVGDPGLVAYMPQADTLLPWRRAFDNVLLGARIRGTDDRALRQRAARLFERFGLTKFERSWPHELSGGMRQRIALLRTMLLERPVLALDEPFGALDAITRVDLQTWLGDVLAEYRTTTVLVTHDIDEALRLADTIIVLSARPARIIGTARPPGAPPRSPSRLTEPELATVKRRILQMLGHGLG